MISQSVDLFSSQCSNFQELL